MEGDAYTRQGDLYERQGTFLNPLTGSRLVSTSGIPFNRLTCSEASTSSKCARNGFGTCERSYEYPDSFMTELQLLMNAVKVLRPASGAVTCFDVQAQPAARGGAGPTAGGGG